MYPNENQNQPIPADYLNQIAPKDNLKPSLLRNKPIIIGLIAMAVLAILIIFFGSMSHNSRPSEQLAARLKMTNDIVDDASSKIKSSKMRALNSDLEIYLTNSIRDIGPLLLKEGVNIDKLSKKILLAESNEKTLATLEDARLNSNYDYTYANEMAYKLNTILTTMKQVMNNTNKKALKDSLSSEYKDLELIQKRFADFNTTTS